MIGLTVDKPLCVFPLHIHKQDLAHVSVNTMLGFSSRSFSANLKDNWKKWMDHQFPEQKHLHSVADLQRH